MPKREEITFELDKIYNENCFNTMRRMPKIIDLVVTSPPYNTSRVGATDKYGSRYDEYSDKMTDEQYIKWSVRLFNSYDRILKSNGVICYNLSYSSENTDLIWRVIGAIINQTNFTTADTIIWKKKSALPNNRSKNKLTRICEFVFVFVRKSEIQSFHCNKKVTSIIERTGQNNYENIFNFIEAKNNDGSNTLNKATFSTEFVLKLIELYGKIGGICYDSFIGTGTTAKASIIGKMRWIGSELSEKQVIFANEQILKI